MATFTYSAYGDLLSDGDTIAFPLNVFGALGTVTTVSVKFTLTHYLPDDLDMLLSSPDGSGFVFWSDVGGTSLIYGQHFIIETGAASLADNAPVVSGTYAPTTYNSEGLETATDFDTTGPISHAPGEGSASFESVFGGVTPAGEWQLTIRDDTATRIGSIPNWGLIVTTDSADAEIVGTAFADYMEVQPGAAGSGHMTLNGSMAYYEGVTGTITLAGGPGSDTYEIRDPNIAVIENVGEGTSDQVIAYIDYTLPQNVENLVLRNFVTSGTGNELANVISGNDSPNELSGNAGDDVLLGFGGFDVLYGGPGNDRLDGGLGVDYMYGGPGNDRLYGDRGKDEMSGGAGQDQFIFRDIADSSHQNAFADLITDFSQSDFDKLVFTDIDADTTNAAGTNDAFTFIGSDPFSAPGQLRYEQLPSNTAVTGDVNGDGVADFLIILTGLFTLTSGDFFL